jgi:hypothetical protein
MTKLFLILLIALFIAEVILAIIAVLNLCKLDRAVNKLNNLISVKQPSIQLFFMDLRAIFEDFTVGIENLKKLINEKKTLYLYNILRTSIVYLSIFSLKGKYKKAAIAVQIAKEIYEGVSET